MQSRIAKLSQPRTVAKLIERAHVGRWPATATEAASTEDDDAQGDASLDGESLDQTIPPAPHWEDVADPQQTDMNVTCDPIEDNGSSEDDPEIRLGVAVKSFMNMILNTEMSQHEAFASSDTYCHPPAKRTRQYPRNRRVIPPPCRAILH